MANLTYRAKVDLGVTVACLLIGGFFAYLSLLIEPETEQLIGSRTVPLFLSVMVMALGLLIAVFALAQGRNGDGDASEIPPEDEFGFADSDVVRVSQVIGSGIIFLIAFWAFGYFVSTIIALALMLLTFGNRNLRTLILMPLIGTTVYQFVFMGLMGLHDPEGALVDFRALSNIISGN
ncbi:MAG: tripartite tricarboxylate transporter TctB family protein [Rhodospirillaceae bacterium]